MRYSLLVRQVLLCLLITLCWTKTRGAPLFGPENLPVFSCRLGFSQGILVNPNTLYVPFKFLGRLIAVEAQVDTVIGTFIIDTGAERLLLNKNYFGWNHRIKDIEAFGTTGAMGPTLFKKVDTLHWDNLFFPDLKAHVVDLSHIENQKKARIAGIIGFEVLKDFEVFLDFQTMIIVVTRLDKTGNRLDKTAIWELPFDSLDFNLRKHLILLDAEVDGHKLKFTLDSGAELNLLDRLAGRKVLEHFEVIKRVKMLGVGEKQVEVLAGKLYDVKFGTQINPPMGTLLTNLDEMNEQFHSSLDGVIGIEFLVTRRTLINYKRKKLFFFKDRNP